MYVRTHRVDGEFQLHNMYVCMYVCMHVNTHRFYGESQLQDMCVCVYVRTHTVDGCILYTSDAADD